MPQVTGIIQHEGPMVDVLIGPSLSTVRQMRLGLQPIPPPEQARALIDTGSETSSVDQALVTRLGLPLAGVTMVNLPAAGGFNVAPERDAALTIPHPSGNAADNHVVPDAVRVELDLAALGYEAVLGRDVLARCVFHYDGPAGTFRLSW